MVSNRRSLVALKASWLIKVIGQAEAAVGAKLHSHDHFVQPFIMVHSGILDLIKGACGDEHSHFMTKYKCYVYPNRL